MTLDSVIIILWCLLLTHAQSLWFMRFTSSCQSRWCAYFEVCLLLRNYTSRLIIRRLDDRHPMQRQWSSSYCSATESVNVNAWIFAPPVFAKWVNLVNSFACKGNSLWLRLIQWQLCTGMLDCRSRPLSVSSLRGLTLSCRGTIGPPEIALHYSFMYFYSNLFYLYAAYSLVDQSLCLLSLLDCYSECTRWIALYFFQWILSKLIDNGSGVLDTPFLLDIAIVSHRYYYTTLV
jgi:hypothetical protein